MREAGVNLVSSGLLVGAARARAGRPTTSNGSTASWTCCTRRHPGRPGHGDRVSAAVAGAPHPETLPVTETGCAFGPGAASTTAPARPSTARRPRIAVRAAKRYATTRRWRCGTSATSTAATYGCYCDVSAEDFRTGCARATATSMRSTRAWCTASGASATPLGRDVPPPARPHVRNPAQVLDWRRFTSDTLLECYRAERAVLRERPRDPGHHELHGVRARGLREVGGRHGRGRSTATPTQDPRRTSTRPSTTT